MAGFRLAVWLAFLYAVNGQIIRFDTGFEGSGIIETSNVGVGPITTESIVTAGLSNPQAGRKICYNGMQIFYTDVADVKDQNGDVVFSTPNGELIWGLTCCCDVIAITYSTATKLKIVIIQVASPIVVYYELTDDETTRAALKCDVVGRVIIVVSRTCVWIFDLANLEDGFTKCEIVPPLPVTSACVACRKTSDGYDIYVSSTGGNTVNLLRVTLPCTVPVTQFAFTVIDSGSNLGVFCVAIDSGTLDLYLLTEGFFFGEWQVRRTTISTATGLPTGPSTVVLQEPGSSPSGISNGFVNGLSVCGTQCNGYDCGDVACDCTGDPPCGFCVYGTGNCQCDNSLDVDPCFYPDGPYADGCETCLTRPDAQLCIFNPLAKRRQGKVVVYGVMSGVGTIDVDRAVRTGRFDPAVWPRPYDAVDCDVFVAGLTIDGFSAPTPDRLRGSRFGVFWGDFVPDGQLLSVCIPGVVTENSGFTNALYTKTVNLNGEVDLVASMISPPVDNVRWQFTRTYFDTKAVAGSPMDVDCSTGSTRLTCRLVGVTRDLHEGVYEVYRTKGNRILRVWHPIFYVYVRQCVDANQYGAGCTSTCNPVCVHGICDDVCGGCVCYPGWRGDACEIDCGSLDVIGDNCDILCADIFPGSTDCAGILVCKASRAGCACRSGLMPPECIDDCDRGYWGPNCLKKCDCGVGATCNAFNGDC